ncbi:hypothetical protein D8I24_6515 [Cupriavidus necator H850]|uniref:hypothetical protein n=1 Tax=Cupriavidus necator TaxID=106590 RepID=UPI00129D56D8|nr:hypothetical protein [Cupriavidus necator]KAI3597699.1 hypothetical protein D8I24_6515 [Cupriavidus necator H850]
MPKLIKPTVGRKVWYRPSTTDTTGPKPMIVSTGQPLDATVIAVWGDRCVNLLVVDIVGNHFPVLSCTLLQDDDVPGVDADGKTVGRYAEWMPYQVAQATKECAAS